MELWCLVHWQSSVQLSFHQAPRLQPGKATTILSGLITPYFVPESREAYVQLHSLLESQALKMQKVLKVLKSPISYSLVFSFQARKPKTSCHLVAQVPVALVAPVWACFDGAIAFAKSSSSAGSAMSAGVLASSCNKPSHQSLSQTEETGPFTNR